MLSVLLFTASDYPLVSFGHCVVCSSSIYGIRLLFGIFWPLCCLFFFYLRHLITVWYFLATVLSVLLLFTASDYPFGIFWPLCCLFFFYLRHLITLWYLLATVLSVLLLFTASDYLFGIFWPLCCLFFFYLRHPITPLVSFGHCVVCSSSIYGVRLPLWYLLSTVLSVLLLFTASDYPLVSFGHCVVCSSSIYGIRLPLWYLLATVLSVLLLFTASDYPIGIFWSLCCLFFFYLRHPITPLVSFGHCVVCSFYIYGIRLPLWYLHICLCIKIDA